MKISLIVPLHGKAGDIRELNRYVQGYGSYQSVKEIIFIITSCHDQELPSLWKERKVKAITFAGATSKACLEAGAFEATGDILFFLKPGTFPRPQFDQLILASLQSNSKAGILAHASSSSLWQSIISRLPLRCALCFTKTDNFFTTRCLFHLKSKYLPRRPSGSFSQAIRQFAVSFNAAIV